MDDRAGRTYAIAFLGEERPGERALTRPTVLRLGPDDDVRVIAESLRRAEADPESCQLHQAASWACQSVPNPSAL